MTRTNIIISVVNSKKACPSYKHYVDNQQSQSNACHETMNKTQKEHKIITNKKMPCVCTITARKHEKIGFKLVVYYTASSSSA